MAQSQFIEYIDSFLPGLTLSIVERLNGTTTAPTPYLHRQMLREDYSVDGKWQSIFGSYSTIMADVVAMDSPFPLKSRDSLGGATGDIAKMGIELWLNEKQLTELDTLVAQGGTKAQIAAKIFEDLPKTITAVYERLEYLFLQGLSTGIALADSDNTGTGIRLDYKYPASNKFGVGVVWSNVASATPVDDINRIVTKATADGNSISRLMMDKTAYNNLIKTTQMKELYGAGIGFGGDYTKIPSLTPTQANSVLLERTGVGTIQIVDWTTRYEKNGTKTTVRPWADGAVVALGANQVGSVVYARLAEESHPVAGVSYQKAGSFILVSKFRENRPSLKEFTTSQARVVPVIADVDQIYLLDSKTVQA